MKAMWHNQALAEASKDELIRIEGNWYSPPTALHRQFFDESDHHTTCIWKGEASYYDVIVEGATNEFGAWFYPEPKEGAVERVKQNFAYYVAFWNGIEIVE